MATLFVITGPSGVGKTYLADKLLQSGQFDSAKVITTRTPRENEKAIDREFVSQATFEAMKLRDELVVHGVFHDNYYGYTKNALQPTDKHLLVNAWPAIMPQFFDLPNVVTVSLTIAPNQQALLYKRMADRGDTPAAIEERKRLIEKDINDIEKLRPDLEKHGRVFTILDDTTIHREIIPWMISL